MKEIKFKVWEEKSSSPNPTVDDAIGAIEMINTVTPPRNKSDYKRFKKQIDIVNRLHKFDE